MLVGDTVAVLWVGPRHADAFTEPTSGAVPFSCGFICAILSLGAFSIASGLSLYERGRV